jgi:GDP-D-mannose dehydratase
VAVVARDAGHARDVVERAERMLADEHPEVTLLSAHHGLHSSDD